MAPEVVVVDMALPSVNPHRRTLQDRNTDGPYQPLERPAPSSVGSCLGCGTVQPRPEIRHVVEHQRTSQPMMVAASTGVVAITVALRCARVVVATSPK